jgi:hypothetical protein
MSTVGATVPARGETRDQQEVVAVVTGEPGGCHGA